MFECLVGSAGGTCRFQLRLLWSPRITFIDTCPDRSTGPIHLMQTLPYDILYYLCHHIEETDTLRSFSTCNRQIRDVAVVRLFESVDFTGGWGRVETAIKVFLAAPDLGRRVR
jgi:hypothetical protein